MYSLGESWFQHSSFDNFTLEREIHSRAASSVDIHLSISRLGRTDSLTEPLRVQLSPRHGSNHLQRQAYLRPQTPAAWRIPRANKTKIGRNSYFALAWWKPGCLSKFAYHLGSLRPQKAGRSGKHKPTLQNPRCLAWLSDSAWHRRKCSELQCHPLVGKKCGREGAGRWGPAPPQESGLVHRGCSATLNAFPNLQLFHRVFHHDSELQQHNTSSLFSLKTYFLNERDFLEWKRTPHELGLSSNRTVIKSVLQCPKQDFKTVPSPHLWAQRFHKHANDQDWKS